MGTTPCTCPRTDPFSPIPSVSRTIPPSSTPFRERFGVFPPPQRLSPARGSNPGTFYPRFRSHTPPKPPSGNAGSRFPFPPGVLKRTWSSGMTIIRSKCMATYDYIQVAATFPQTSESCCNNRLISTIYLLGSYDLNIIQTNCPRIPRRMFEYQSKRRASFWNIFAQKSPAARFESAVGY